MAEADAWLELSVSAEPEAVESVSAAFAEYGQGVALEQAVESSRDGDIGTDSDADVDASENEVDAAADAAHANPATTTLAPVGVVARDG